MLKIFRFCLLISSLFVGMVATAANNMPATDTQVQQNIQTVEAFYKAAADKNDNDINRFFVPNYRLVDLGVLKKLANANVSLKSSDVAQRVMSARKIFPDMTVKVNDIFGQGNKVFADVTIAGHQQAEFLGIAPTGKMITMRWFVVFTFDQNGKIVESTQLDDELSVMDQLGYIVLR